MHYISSKHQDNSEGLGADGIMVHDIRGSTRIMVSARMPVYVML